MKEDWELWQIVIKKDSRIFLCMVILLIYKPYTHTQRQKHAHTLTHKHTNSHFHLCFQVVSLKLRSLFQEVLTSDNENGVWFSFIQHTHEKQLLKFSWILLGFSSLAKSSKYLHPNSCLWVYFWCCIPETCQDVSPCCGSEFHSK